MPLIYQDKLSDEAKAKYFTKHLDAATADTRNGGAHFLFLDKLAHRLKQDEHQPFLLSSHPNIADIQIFDIIDLVSFFFNLK